MPAVSENCHVRIPARLIADARRAAELPADTRPADLIKLALARLAGWPDAAAETIARLPVTSSGR